MNTYRGKGILLSLMLICLFSAKTEGAVLYLKESLLWNGQDLQLKDLVFSFPGDKEYPWMNTPVALDESKITLIFPSFLESFLQGDFMIIGKCLAVIPEELLTSGSPDFFINLGNFLADQEGGQSIELEISGFSTPPGQGEYTFRRLSSSETRSRIFFKGEKESGIFDLTINRIKNMIHNPTEVSEEIKKITFKGNRVNNTTAEKLVKGGDKIVILFVKGNIELKIAGKAYSSGGLDEEVKVSPFSSSQHFQGRVTGEKEVRVEIE